jgi:hypothetical protein
MFNNVNVVSILLTGLQSLRRDSYPSVREVNGKPQPLVVSQRTPAANPIFFPHLL